MADSTTTSPANAPASTSAAPAAALPSFDPAKSYKVTLTRVIEWPPNSNFFCSPRDEHVFRGDVCQDVAYAIADAHEV